MNLNDFCDIFCWPYLGRNWSQHLPFTFQPTTRLIYTTTDDCIIGTGRYGYDYLTRTVMVVIPMSFIPHNPHLKILNLKLAICVENGPGDDDMD